MGSKAAKTTHNISNAYSPGTAKEMYSSMVVQEVLQNFETRALKMRSSVAGHQKLTVTNWEPSSELILLKLHEKLPKNSVLMILWLCGIWSKLERWNSLISGRLMNWPQIKKMPFWSVVFSYSVQQQWTISWLDCDMCWKVYFTWQPAMTSSVVGLRRSSRSLPKAKLVPRVMVTVWWSAAL